MLNLDLLKVVGNNIKTNNIHQTVVFWWWFTVSESKEITWSKQKPNISNKHLPVETFPRDPITLLEDEGCTITSSERYLGSISILRRWARIPRDSNNIKGKNIIFFSMPRLPQGVLELIFGDPRAQKNVSKIPVVTWRLLPGKGNKPNFLARK